MKQNLRKLAIEAVIATFAITAFITFCGLFLLIDETGWW